MRMIPKLPLTETFSPRITYAITIKNSGVKARKGMVRLMGDTFNAFVYRMIAVISRGRAHSVASQNVLSREGISTNSKLATSTGRANNNLAHATKYSSLEARARFVKASLVARENAVKRE
jgi:hypothetical protein